MILFVCVCVCVTVAQSQQRMERARSITSMSKDRTDSDYEALAPSFGNTANRRYNFYTSRKSESRPESRAESRPESRLGDSRKSELRQSESRFLSDVEAEAGESESAAKPPLQPSNEPSSFLKDYHARKSRIVSSSKKYEKYKTYSDQISKLTNKYSRQLSPESDVDSKTSEVLEKNISLGPERSVTPTPATSPNGEQAKA